MTDLSIRAPEDVIDDRKEIAASLGISGTQPLMRAYIGQGLRKHGIADQIISATIADAQRKTA